MTLLQAMSRVDWEARVTNVIDRIGYYGLAAALKYGPAICEVCGNEMAPMTFAVVQTSGGEEFHVDVGKACADDLKRCVQPPRARRS